MRWVALLVVFQAVNVFPYSTVVFNGRFYGRLNESNKRKVVDGFFSSQLIPVNTGSEKDIMTLYIEGHWLK